MKFFINLFRLTRPLSNTKNVLIIFLAFFLSGTEFHLGKAILGFLSLSLACSAVYAFNTLSDSKIDKNNKNKEHYSESVLYFGAKKIYIILASAVILGLVSGFFVNVYFFLIILLILFFGFLYSSPSARFKERVLLDVLFGAIFTFPLRFIAAWFIFKISFPPLLPILALAFAKGGGYMMYKELDRQFLLEQHIKNSITGISRKNSIIISSLLMFFSIISVFLMCFNSEYLKIGLLGYLPFKFLILLPLAFPPLIVIYLKIFNKINIKNNNLRIIGFIYALFSLVFGVILLL